MKKKTSIKIHKTASFANPASQNATGTPKNHLGDLNSIKEVKKIYSEQQKRKTAAFEKKKSDSEFFIEEHIKEGLRKYAGLFNYRQVESSLVEYLQGDLTFDEMHQHINYPNLRKHQKLMEKRMTLKKFRIAESLQDEEKRKKELESISMMKNLTTIQFQQLSRLRKAKYGEEIMKNFGSVEIDLKESSDDDDSPKRNEWFRSEKGKKLFDLLRNFILYKIKKKKMERSQSETGNYMSDFKVWQKITQKQNDLIEKIKNHDLTSENTKKRYFDKSNMLTYKKMKSCFLMKQEEVRNTQIRQSLLEAEESMKPIEIFPTKKSLYNESVKDFFDKKIERYMKLMRPPTPDYKALKKIEKQIQEIPFKKDKEDPQFSHTFLGETSSFSKSRRFQAIQHNRAVLKPSPFRLKFSRGKVELVSRSNQNPKVSEVKTTKDSRIFSTMADSIQEAGAKKLLGRKISTCLTEMRSPIAFRSQSHAKLDVDGISSHQSTGIRSLDPFENSLVTTTRAETFRESGVTPQQPLEKPKMENSTQSHPLRIDKGNNKGEIGPFTSKDRLKERSGDRLESMMLKTQGSRRKNDEKRTMVVSFYDKVKNRKDSTKGTRYHLAMVNNDTKYTISSKNKGNPAKFYEQEYFLMKDQKMREYFQERELSKTEQNKEQIENASLKRKSENIFFTDIVQFDPTNQRQMNREIQKKDQKSSYGSNTERCICMKEYNFDRGEERKKAISEKLNTRFFTKRETLKPFQQKNEWEKAKNKEGKREANSNKETRESIIQNEEEKFKFYAMERNITENNNEAEMDRLEDLHSKMSDDESFTSKNEAKIDQLYNESIETQQKIIDRKKSKASVSSVLKYMIKLEEIQK